MRVEALKKYQGQGGISELTQPSRHVAERWFGELLARAKARGRRLERWYIAILCGIAKRLAVNPPTREWGVSMNRKKAAYGRHREAQRQGICQTTKATYCSKLIRASRKRKKEEAEYRASFFEEQERRNDRYTAKVMDLASKGISPFS
jgi:hypothetical protein